MEASSYLYGLPSSEILHIDDLFDFSKDDIFDTEAADARLTLPESIIENGILAGDTDEKSNQSDFSEHLCVPTDDVAQLEWLSKFVDDSFSEYPVPVGWNQVFRKTNSRPDTSVPGRARTKRSRVPAQTNSWSSLPSADSVSGEHFSGSRKCTHCLTEKTPQWRMGPTGPKTLCNACGVRYKSGRLVPEYRPAASPTFVLTQHSNSHRKVMELRRQKEVLRQQESFHDFQVC